MSVLVLVKAVELASKALLGRIERDAETLDKEAKHDPIRRAQRRSAYEAVVKAINFNEAYQRFLQEWTEEDFLQEAQNRLRQKERVERVSSVGSR